MEDGALRRRANPMHNIFDALGKGLLRGTLHHGGDLHPAHEVTSPSQSVDGWFQPDPARDDQLRHRGTLGRMARGDPALFEPFHDPPDLDEVRDCIHKQLAVDRTRRRKARRDGAPRPPFPKLWLISAGRPRGVLHAYGFKPMRGWPEGFWQRSKPDALGLVVVRDLPGTRDTLMLRLMGAGPVLREAIAELQRLPGEAWERHVAMPLLLATRFDLPQDGSEEALEYMMSTQSLYEQWYQQVTEQGRSDGLKRGLEQGVAQGFQRGIEKGIEKGIEQGREQGREQALRQALLTVYRARFGGVPAEVAAIVDAAHELPRLERWIEKVAACSAEDFAAELRAGEPQEMRLFFKDLQVNEGGKAKKDEPAPPEKGATKTKEG